MLKALRLNGSLLVLGLNPKEVEHLKNGNPLHVKLADVGGEHSQVILFMGATDEDMKKRFERSGLAKPEPGLIDVSKVRFN
jgi:hypothetical protein